MQGMQKIFLYTWYTQRTPIQVHLFLSSTNRDSVLVSYPCNTQHQNNSNQTPLYTKRIIITHSPQYHLSNHPLYDSTEKIVHPPLQSPQLYPVYKSDIIVDV